MGSFCSSSQSTNSSSSYTPNSQALGAYSGALSNAQQVGQTPFNPATQGQVAGLTPLQQQAFSQIQGMQGQYQPMLNQAASYATQAASPQNLLDLQQQYQNPYQQQVTNATMGQLNTLFGQQRAGLQGNAISQNALGGSREGVAEANQNYLQGQTAASTLAGLNQAGFNTSMANAQQTAGQQANAGYQLANLASMNQNLGLQGTNALYGAGAAQQGQQQNVYNVGSQNAQMQTMWAPQMAQWTDAQLAALGPLMGGTTTGNSTTTGSPSGLSLLGSGLGIVGSLPSDAHLKENIHAVGKTFDGQTIYKYNLKGDPHTQIGLLAQEVEKKHPDSVGESDGYKTVNYDAATRDAEHRKHFADGGSAFGGFQDYMPWATLSPSHMTVPQLSQSPQTKSGQTDALAQSIKQGQQLGKGLSGIGTGLFGSSSPTSTGDGGWQTGTQSSGLLGSGGFMNSLSSGLSSLGDSLGSAFGFADGGAAPGFDDGGDTSLAPVDPNSFTARTLGDALSYFRPDLAPSIERWRNGTPPVAPAVTQEAAQTPGISGLTQSVTQPTPNFTPQESGLNPIQKAIPQGYGATANPFENVPVSALPAPQETAPENGNVTNPFAATPQAGITSPAMPTVGRQAVAGTVRDELMAGGANDSAIRGILANTKDESGFDPALRHPDQPKWTGEAHYAHGLFQEGGAEWNKYAQWLEQNHTGADWRDPQLQTQFLVQNLKENYPDTWKKMNEGSPEQAAQEFVSGYLKPAKQFELARREQYGRGVPDFDTLVGGLKSGAGAVGQGVKAGLTGLADAIPGTGQPTQTPSATTTSAPAEDKGSFFHQLLNANPLGITRQDAAKIRDVGSILSHGAPAYGAQDQLRAENATAQKMALELMKPVKIGQDSYGNELFGVPNMKTGRYEPISMNGTGATAPGGQTATGGSADAILREAQDIANYDRPGYSGRAAEQPHARQVMDIAHQIGDAKGDPYDATMYAAKQKERNSWATPATKITLEAGNTGIGHLYDLTKSVDSIGNTWNPTYNSVRNFIREQTGDPRADVFKANAGLVAEELTKFYRGAGGAEADIKRLLDDFDAARSPQQQKQVLGRLASMVEDKVSALKQTRDFAYGADRGEKNYPILTPESKAKVEYIKRWGAGESAAPSQAGSTQAPIATGARPTGMSNIQLREMAQQNIQRGASRDAVNQRLAAWGIQPI